MIFKRLKLNIAEHFILGGITLLGLLISSSILFLFGILDNTFNSSFFRFSKFPIALFILFFPAWSYFNATKKLYTFWRFLWRIISFYILTFLEFLLIIIFITAVILKDNNIPIEINI